MKMLRNCVQLLFIGLIATAVSSCLSDNDDNNNNEYQISQAEYGVLLGQMSGQYNGKLYFYNDTIKQYDRTDSVFVNEQVSGVGDSTVIVPAVPTRVLSRLIPNGRYDNMRTALEEMEDQQITAKFYLSQKSSGGGVYFIVYPRTLNINVEYDGATHLVEYIFYGGTVGQYYNNKISIPIYLYGIRVDGSDEIRKFNNTTSYIDNYSILNLYGEK